MRSTRIALAALGLIASLSLTCSRSDLARRHGALGAGAAAAAGGDGGDGAAMGGGAAGAPAGGGGSGAGAVCAFDLPVVAVADPSEYFVQGSPTLVASGLDAETVTVVLSWGYSEGPGEIPPPEVRHASFAPWSSWPAAATIEPVLSAEPDAGAAFAAATHADGFAIAFRNLAAPPVPSDGLFFMPGLVPGAGAVPESFLVSATATRPFFVAGSGGLHLTAWGVQGFEGEIVEAALLKKVVEGTYVQGPLPLGCSAAGSAGAAVMSDDASGDFVVAFVSTSPVGTLDCLAQPVPALAVARVAANGTVLPVATIGSPPPAPGALVRVARSGDAIWVLWGTNDASVCPSAFALARLTSEGALSGGPALVCLGAFSSMALFGENVVALADAVSNGDVHSLRVRLFDASVFDGDTALTVAELPLANPVAGPPALLASPTNASLLLAWPEERDDSFITEVRLARLDCGFLL